MSTPGSEAKAVFVSHSSKDAALAQKICRLLEERGVPCWIAPRDIRPGYEYGEEIIRAIEGGGALVLVMSESANASRHVANEVARAFSKDKLIVPIRAANIAPSKGLELFVSSAHWVEAWQGGLDAKMDEVAASIRQAMGAPASAQPQTERRAAGAAAARGKLAALALAACAALIVAGTVLLLWRGPSGPATRGAVPGPATPAGAPESAGADARALIPRYQAVLIGVNSYAVHGGSGWGSLTTARPDAEAVAAVLKRDYGFEVKTLFDEQATRGAILATLDGLVKLTANDAVLVYFAGHGFYDESLGEGYWIPADARKMADGRPAKEDWIWNSMVSKILSASAARHLLVVADSCYSGSLFRGEEDDSNKPDLGWYKRAVAKPSRYLIASGDIEPVLDSGARHSVFAQQMLAFLEHGDRPVFSASDLGVALRGKVNELTGQMVRMGPLAVAGDAGGEFVFVRQGAAAELAAAPLPASPPEARTRAAPGPPPVEGAAATKTMALRDALALGQAGATNAAGSLVAGIAQGGRDDVLTRAVVAYLDRDRGAREREAVDGLIRYLEERKKAGPGEGGGAPLSDAARPRILACLGPSVRQGGAEAESLALLYRIALRSEVEGQGGVIVIEREALEKVLQEMQIGASDLADARARTEIGKLLPASLLMLGDILPAGDGERVYLRLVETETTKVLASFSAERKAKDDVAQVCADLAAKVVAKAVAARPLEASADRVADTGLLLAKVGSFHGARDDTEFVLVERTPAAPGSADYRETEIGRAKIKKLGETTADLIAEWSGDAAAKPPKTVWVREAAAAQP